MSLHSNTPTLSIAIEGNIGSGKTTFANLLMHHDNLTNSQIDFFPEPLQLWVNFHGDNLLKKFYQYPEIYSFPFESYVLLTMSKMHKANLKPGASIKLMERSIYSAYNCFIKNMKSNNQLNNTEYQILKEWYKHVLDIDPNKHLDYIIYLKTDPSKCLERIISRGREGEANISLEYLNQLKLRYKDWFSKQNPDQIIIVNNNCHEFLLDSLAQKILREIHQKQKSKV